MATETAESKSFGSNGNQMMFSLFDTIIRSPLNRFMEQAVDEGKIPIGYTCSYIPRMILSAKNLVPFRVFAPGVSSTEMADTYLPSTICSYTKSILDFAINGRYDFLKGWVLTSSCQHMSRFFDNLKHTVNPPFIKIIDLPNRVSESAIRWMMAEMNELRTDIQTHFQITVSDEDLNEAINRHNDSVQLLSAIGELRKNKTPVISGTEFHKLMMAALVAPEAFLFKPLSDIKDALSKRELKEDYRARVILVGGQLDDPAYINIIEQSGALVVSDRICTGSIPGLDPIPHGTDPIERISAHTLTKTSCPRMMDNFQARLAAIISAYETFQADGIIIEAIKFCDTWGLEARELTDSLREKGIPVLKLEREYRITGEGQLKTRIQAFIESMGK
ncbi:MAG: 2-hydroxyacyl-CoA dehydratase family protein [Proteobacteria bacterium]|nr:2-hydroxyacyl-CoA dehydratase family protein [Pseudomonadota bacterium]